MSSSSENSDIFFDAADDLAIDKIKTIKNLKQLNMSNTNNHDHCHVKLKEIRQCMSNCGVEEKEVIAANVLIGDGNKLDSSPSPSSRTSYPFRIIENSDGYKSDDSHSLCEPSTSKLHSIHKNKHFDEHNQQALNETNDLSIENVKNPPEHLQIHASLNSLQEPDLISSTNSCRDLYPPVAPPRRSKLGTRPSEHTDFSLFIQTLIDTSKEDDRNAVNKPYFDSISNKSQSQGDTSFTKTKSLDNRLISNRNNEFKIMKDEERSKTIKPSLEKLLLRSGDYNDNKFSGKLSGEQLNLVLRTKTESGNPLSDTEILEQITVLNLDTGERIPLSMAEETLPKCMNPLSLHIMRLTNEFASSNLDELKTENISEIVNEDACRFKRGKDRIKKFFGCTVRKTLAKAKYFKSHKQDDNCHIEIPTYNEEFIKLKASSTHKGPYEFENSQVIQDLSGEHVGPVWCMKFSYCGKLLATAGQDRLLRIWVLKDSYTLFKDMRRKYDIQTQVTPNSSQESLGFNQFEDELQCEEEIGPFMSKPFCLYSGHTSDLLDISWSKNYFILSSSMDKTVRLWHLSRKECLCCFQHIDFVTAIVFHPKDDRYFISGSLDGKIRLWNIPDKKVAVWNEIAGQTKLVTAANFCRDGQFVVIGTYDGKCIFYKTDDLKYYTQINVKSSRGKNSIGRKISGIEPMPGEDKILVTSNDSRIRLYDLRDLNLTCKFKGFLNNSSQIKGSFSHDGKFIICGSENQYVYIWKTKQESVLKSGRKDRNDLWEGIKIHNAVVTCAIFASHPEDIARIVDESGNVSFPNECQSCSDDDTQSSVVESSQLGAHVLITADFAGSIKVSMNKIKTKGNSPTTTDMGVPEAIMESISACPEESLPHFLNNVVVVGGCSLFPGMRTRLQMELRSLAPDDVKVCVRLPKNPISYAWEGGVTLSKSSDFHQRCITRDDYEEEGAILGVDNDD